MTIMVVLRNSCTDYRDCLKPNQNLVQAFTNEDKLTILNPAELPRLSLVERETQG